MRVSEVSVKNPRTGKFESMSYEQAIALLERYEKRSVRRGRLAWAILLSIGLGAVLALAL